MELADGGVQDCQLYNVTNGSVRDDRSAAACLWFQVDNPIGEVGRGCRGAVTAGGRW